MILIFSSHNVGIWIDVTQGIKSFIYDPFSLAVEEDAQQWGTGKPVYGPPIKVYSAITADIDPVNLFPLECRLAQFLFSILRFYSESKITSVLLGLYLLAFINASVRPFVCIFCGISRMLCSVIIYKTVLSSGGIFCNTDGQKQKINSGKFQSDLILIQAK